MGRIIIETPQNFSREFRIVSPDSAREILSKLENSIAEANFLEAEEILNLWLEREETALEIAEKTRRLWKRKL